METTSAFDEDWKLLVSLLPREWQQKAILLGAVERLRGFASIGDLLRTLLLHVGKGCSLRDTAVWAKAAGWAEVSDVAVLKRLRNAERWLQWLCVSLVEESGWEVPLESRGWNVRAVDGTLVKEPGPKGGLWRIHYSLQIPSLYCDHMELTATRGVGTGEKLSRFPAQAGDLILADRGFCTPAGVAALQRQGADVIVRVNTGTMPFLSEKGTEFDLAEQVRTLTEPNQMKSWKVQVKANKQLLKGRLCTVRKSEERTRAAQRKIRRKAQQGGPQFKPETLLYAAYVLVFTTLPEASFSEAEVLEWYRVRWQIELVFKRLKSLAGLGELPNQDERSARSWLYGKLLLALLGQKLMRVGRDISPWGYRFAESWKWQRVAGI
jgi:hypothetical protein